MTTNSEIIRFSNWWVGASFYDNWEEKKEIFFKYKNKYIDEVKTQINIVFIDHDFNTIIEKLDNICHIKENVKAVGLIKEN